MSGPRHRGGLHAPTSAAETLAYLIGGWDVERDVLDRHSGEAGTFTGRARFTPTPAGATYSEHGRLRWPTYDGPASRRLRYEVAGDGVLAVRFADGRPFHTLELSGGRASYQHPCGDDLYVGTLTVVDQDEWRQVWRVAGKQPLEIRTRFRRRSV